jgi:hypothetical protein
VTETLVDTPSWLLHTNGGLALHVPADLASQTTCSLLELEQWHEPDIQFLSKLLAPDAIALDAGADHGMYAVALGRHLGKGRVWALEPDACALRRLQCSVQANGLQERVALLAVQLTGPGASGDRQDTLDGFAARHLAGCPIDLVRMDDRAPVAAILDGGQQVIATDRPILLLPGRSVRPGQAVSQRLAALGYGLFSYLPELEVLAPVDLLSADDFGERPCWAVALERIAELARRGLLADVDAVLRAPNPPVLEQAVAPYLVALQRTITGHTERERSAADRVALLMAARDDLQAALNAGDESGLEAWALLVHLLHALGQRAAAVELANELLKQWDRSLPISRPVMPPRREDLDLPRTQPDADWLQLRLAEFVEVGQPWTPWSTALAASRLAALTAQPDHRPAMARRQLIAHLCRDEALPGSLLHAVAHHPRTVNSDLWRAVAARFAVEASADAENTSVTEPVNAATGVTPPLAGAAADRAAVPTASRVGPTDAVGPVRRAPQHEESQMMFVEMPDVERSVVDLAAAGRYTDAVSNLVLAVHNTHRIPAYAQGFMHYPGLDRLIEPLAMRAMQDALHGAPSAPARGATLVVATEMYTVGGHSRVVADLLRELPEPTLVLTDLFGNYRKACDNLNWVHEQNPQAAVLVLLQVTLWAKCVELARLVQRLAPRQIIYLQHHQDAIAFIGTHAYPSAHKTLVHHCDHNPSLGGTLASVAHMDFTDEQARECTQVLQRPSRVLPLYVPDQGIKRFRSIAGRDYSVVTSGTTVKFARTGPVALQTLALTVLRATEGRFFHIGPLDAAWLADIHDHLAAHAVDSSRFVALGPVGSLWQTLAQLDAHLYLGSAPVGGGRAAIEAQGCGYPVVFYRSDVQSSTTLRVDSVYASKELGWSSLDELRQVLRTFPDQQARLSAQARSLYEANYNRQAFVTALQAMLTPT